MKIIEPITNLGALSTNNAPIDHLEEWAPIGRDLLSYIEKPVFDVVGDLMIAVSESGGTVYKVDLITGIVATTALSIPAGVKVSEVSISPDESHVSIITPAYRIDVLRVADDTVVYSDSKGYELTKRNGLAVAWVPDSTACFYSIADEVRRLSLPSYSVSGSYEPNGVASIIATAAGVFYIAYVPSGNNIITKRSNAGALQDSLQDSNGLGLHKLVYNAILNTIVAITTREGNNYPKQAYSIDQATLLSSLIPSFPDDYYVTNDASTTNSIQATTAHLILRSKSTTPYWNYYNLSNYSLAKSLPALPDVGEGIAVGTNYTVIQQNNGIALIDNIDDSIITQQNPSVVAGDSYIYENNIYEVLVSNNDQPDNGTVLDPPTWLDRGKINPLRMFDGKLDSLTTSNNDLTVTISPERIVSGIALFNVDAAIVRVTMTDPTDGLVYDSGDISMIDNSDITDWFAFYFSPYIKKSDFVSMMLPPYPDAEIVVTVRGLGAQVSIGEIVLGRTFTLGVAQFGSSIGILDFSEKEQDQFGNFNIIERKFSKRADYDVKIPTNTVSGVQRILSRFRATPAVWVGDENREETIVYGYYKSFDIVLSNPALADTSILVEGL